MDVTCPYCGNPAVLVDSKEIYFVRSYGMAWICSPCGAWVGCHKNSPNHAPLGRLANAELRKAKQAAHVLFDPLFAPGGPFLRRKDAYAWLALVMGIPKRQAHIGYFDVDQCKRLVEILERDYHRKDKAPGF